MKKNIILTLAAVTVLAGACSKEITPSSGVNNQEFFTDGEGWVKLNLNLPTTPATKANDVFDDGAGYEYAVENAHLVVFAGSRTDVDEDKCTLRSAYDLSSGDWNKDGNTQITTTRTITQKVMSKNINDEFVYAFVILNDHFYEVKASTADKEITTLYKGGADLTGTTFADFKKHLLDESDKDFNNIAFTMTNMPHIHTLGGSVTPATERPWSLVRFNSTLIYKTEADARGGEAGAEIDVERVVAKVTVKADIEENKLANNDEVEFEVLGWFIDNTNPNAYVVRNVADPVKADAPYGYLAYKVNGKNRMASATAVHTHDIYSSPESIETGVNVVRTYWGFDPNYNADATALISEGGKMVNNHLMNFNENHVNVGGRLREIGSSYYCAENTMDVAHMTVENTTRVIIAARFNGGESFYTLTSEPNTIMGKTLAEKKVKSMVLKRVNISNWLNKFFTTASEEDLLKLFDVTITNTTNGLDAQNNPIYTGKATATIALTDIDDNIKAILKSATELANAKAEYAVIADDQNDYIAKSINNQLNFYKGGDAYYQALIRHFDDTETPWTGNVNMTNTTASIYNNNDENAYLGRYGVLRNNWYDITVTGIRQIGSATVPELTDDPDDIVEQYIKVKINIMPWAKRTQSVIL